MYLLNVSVTLVDIFTEVHYEERIYLDIPI